MSIVIHYVITSIAPQGTVGVNVGYQLSEVITGITESHLDYLLTSALNQGVTGGMNPTQITTQLKNNFESITTSTLTRFAALAEATAAQLTIAAGLASAGNNVTEQSLPVIYNIAGFCGEVEI